MSLNDRVKRPPLERIQAIRNWSTLFKGPAADGSGAGAESAAPDSASLNDVVARSVDLGYRVVDEYVRQGQKAAQRLNERSYGAQTMAGDVQDLAMRLTQYASDFAAVWLQLVQLAAAGNGAPNVRSADDGVDRPAPKEAAGNPTSDATAGRPTRAEGVPLEATRVRIEVRSAQPTEVAIDIRPDSTRRALIVHALRGVDPDTPRLDQVSFDAGSDEAPARLHIHVPPGQPPGIYSGLMIDEGTSRPVGTVSVTITE